MNEQLLKQLGIDQQIMQQLIDERAALAEADRLNIAVTDAEVINRITSFPAFQEERRLRWRRALPAGAVGAAARRSLHPSSKTASAVS
jgi:hypothetical protein